MDTGVIIVIVIFVVLPAAITINNWLTERRMKKRAEQFIALDRIAGQLDIGVNQLTIGIVSKAFKQWSGGSTRAQQFWKVPIHYRPNDGSRGNGMTAQLKLNGTDDTRAIEDQMIKIIKLDREYPERLDGSLLLHA